MHPGPRAVTALVVFLVLKLAGEAAFGEQRTAFERQWRGAAAIFLVLAGAVHLWGRHRRTADGATERAHRRRAAARPAFRVVTMPSLGADVVDGTVTRWFKRVGEEVRAGEPLAEVSTDKVDVEIPAEPTGVLREIRVGAGEAARVGATIAVIGR